MAIIDDEGTCIYEELVQKITEDTHVHHYIFTKEHDDNAFVCICGKEEPKDEKDTE